ncbi:hypothetical protein SFRURICE_008588, partial [Spodoptera frugiperda]
NKITPVDTIDFFSSPLIISSGLFRCGIQDSHSCPWEAPDFSDPSVCLSVSPLVKLFARSKVWIPMEKNEQETP